MYPFFSSHILEESFINFFSNTPNTIALIFDKNFTYHFVCGDLFTKNNFKKEDYIGKSLHDFIGIDELPIYLDHYEAVFKGERRTHESIIQGRHFAHTLFPLIQASENNMYGVVYSQDISELRKSQKELSIKEEQYNWLLENSSAGFFDWDMVNDVTYRSKRVWEILEFEENELGASFFSMAPYVHPDDNAWLQIIMGELLTNYSAPKTVQYRVYTKLGKMKWLEVKMTLIKNHEDVPYRMIATVLDITSQKDSEEKILENEQLFKVLFKQSYHIHYLLESTGMIKEINHEALSMNALDPLSQPNVFVWDLPFFKQSNLDQATLKQYIQQALTENIATFQAKINTKELCKIVDFSIKPIHHHTGYISALMMEGKEVTEIIKATDYAIENARVISLKNKQLEEFAHITSHNLRSPAVNVKMLLQLWSTAIEESERTIIREKLKNASDHLLDTIDTLALNLQIREDRTIVKEQILFNDIFETIKNINSVLIQEANPDIQTDFTEAPEVYFPALYLESVFQNLLTNSIKYASNKHRLSVSVKSYYVNDRVCLEFSDNGIGMDLNTIKNKIFGLYKTFHGNPDARGVGLFITKTQMEAMGGKIEVVSEPHKGTTFTLQF